MNIRIIGRWTMVFLTVVLLIAIAVWAQGLKPDAVCSSLHITIEDVSKRQYVTVNELLTYVTNNGCTVRAIPSDSVHLQQIEDVLRRHPMIRTAECYLLTDGTAEVCVTQRVPSMRVETPEERYIVDSDHKVMPLRTGVGSKVLCARGHIGRTMACGELVEFVEWLQSEYYWHKLIQSIVVNNPKQVCLVDTLNHHIQLGALDGYEHKMKKLRYFLIETAQDSLTYKEIDLRYKGQVITR